MNKESFTYFTNVALAEQEDSGIITGSHFGEKTYINRTFDISISILIRPTMNTKPPENL